jgi:hypothetical protein
MATLYSLELGGSITGRPYPVSGVGLGGRTIHSARGEYTISAALALNDTIQLFDLPPRARVVGGFVKSDDLDSGGTALRLDIGEAGDVDRFLVGAAGTPGPVAGVANTLAATGYDYVTTKKTRVFGTVSAAPTTGATTGALVVVLHYFVEEPA